MDGIVKGLLDLSAGTVGGNWRCALCVFSAGLGANTCVVSRLKVLHTDLCDVVENCKDGNMSSKGF